MMKPIRYITQPGVVGWAGGGGGGGDGGDGGGGDDSVGGGGDSVVKAPVSLQALRLSKPIALTFQ